jgi:two-component sensor histidine kinase
MMSPIIKIADAQTLAQAIVNTIIEPFIVLDDAFCVLAASRSFYDTFKVSPEQTQGRLLYDLGDGQWDIPALRVLLETIIPEKVAMDGFEVEHDFPLVGKRTMLLNARKVIYDNSDTSTILLAFLDVTERRIIEREKAELLSQAEELLRQKQMLLQEMQHRVANSLQIIASVILQSARRVQSEEARSYLTDAHSRVMSVAALQRQLAASRLGDVELRRYFKQLCESISASMIRDPGQLTLEVDVDDSLVRAEVSVSLGLVVTELVINALKHAFPGGRPGRVVVRYHSQGADWNLSVTDDGVGLPNDPANVAPGLGTSIVAALANQLHASVQRADARPGTIVSLVHAQRAPEAPEPKDVASESAK